VNHSEAVTKHHLAAQQAVEEGYWDKAFREVSYYENDTAPHPGYPDQKGMEEGEFDVLLVNYDDKTAFYKEIKTSMGDMMYAKEQIERAEEHFDEWDIIGRRVLED